MPSVTRSHRTKGLSQFNPCEGESANQIMCVLLRAHECARSSQCDGWDFAVQIYELRELRIDWAELRHLVTVGYVKHAHETTGLFASKRSFRLATNLRFTDCSCIVAAVDAWPMFRRSLRTPKSNGAATPTRSRSTAQEPVRTTPKWDRELRQLWFRGKLVQQFKEPADNQEAVLDAFEESEWSVQISDPLTPLSGICSKRRLHSTIQSLNRHHLQSLIRFHGDGTGRRVTCQPRR